MCARAHAWIIMCGFVYLIMCLRAWVCAVCVSVCVCCVNECVGMCVCIYICMYVYTHIYVYICMYMGVHVYVCMCVCVYMWCVYVYECMFVWIHLFGCVVTAITDSFVQSEIGNRRFILVPVMHLIHGWFEDRPMRWSRDPYRFIQWRSGDDLDPRPRHFMWVFVLLLSLIYCCQ